jgi:hemolysin III
MILASAAYNLKRRGPTKEILRRIDRAAIFVMIAATYTPFAANRLPPETGGALLFVIWTCATAGVGCTLMFPRRFERFSLLLYLTMGWMVVAVIKPLSASVAPFDLALLFAGGIVYSTGVTFHLLDRIPHHKTIWHTFVLAASALQFVAIAAEFST